MATTNTIPITVEPAAAARVEELGLRREFEAMLEFLKQNVPGLHAIRVEFDPDADPSWESTVVLDTVQDEPPNVRSELDPSVTAWRSWVIDTFPPDVFRHFCRLSTYEPSNGR